MAKQFDFLMLSPGRVATLEIVKYLNSHPDIYIPDFHITDNLLRMQNVTELKAIASDEIDRKVGLLLHWPDVVLNQATLALIPELVAPNLLIQMVREPQAMLMSYYNHVLLRSFLNILDEPGTPEAYFAKENNYRLAKYYELGNAYAEHFVEWQVVDFAEMQAKHIQTTTRNLFELLGVEANFSSDIFKMSQNDRTSVYMQMSKPIQLHNNILNLKMSYQMDQYYMSDDMVVIATYENAVRDFQLPFDPWPICLFAPKSEWESFSIALRNEIRENGELDAAIQTWLTDFSDMVINVEIEYEKRRLKVLPEVTKAHLNSALGNDIALMQQKFPQLREFWKV